MAALYQLVYCSQNTLHAQRSAQGGADVDVETWSRILDLLRGVVRDDDALAA